MIGSFISKIDLVGSEISLEKDDSNRFRTIQGGALTFIILAVCTTLAFLFGKEIWERKTPTVVSSKEMLVTSEILMKDFLITFSFITNDGQDIVFEDYLSSSVETITFNSVQAITDDDTTTYNLQPCDLNKYNSTIEPDVLNAFRAIPYKQFCLNADETLSFQNDFGTENSKMIDIYIYKCNSNITKCADDIDIITQHMLVLISFQDTYLQSQNYTNPVVKYLHTINTFMANTMRKDLVVDFTKDEYQSDNGWLLEDVQIMDYISYQDSQVEFFPLANTPGMEMASISLASPPIRNKTFRSYLKIQELFAKIGGIVNAMFLLVKVLFSSYLRFLYLQFIRDCSISKYNINKFDKTLNIKKCKERETSNLELNIRNHLASNDAVSSNNLKDLNELTLKHQDTSKNHLLKNSNINILPSNALDNSINSKQMNVDIENDKKSLGNSQEKMVNNYILSNHINNINNQKHASLNNALKTSDKSEEKISNLLDLIKWSNNETYFNYLFSFVGKASTKLNLKFNFITNLISIETFTKYMLKQSCKEEIRKD